MRDEIKENSTEDLLMLYQQNNDIEIRNKIVIEYSSMVKGIAYQMRGIFTNYAHIDDVVNQGIIALIECIDRFEVEKHAKFETFAYKRIKGAVIDYVRKQDWVPRRVRLLSKKINKAYDELSNQLLREPTHEELANFLEISVESLEKCYSETAGAMLLSFESSIQGSEDKFFAEPIDLNSSADARLYKDELQQVLKDSLDLLKPRERQILTLYYYEELKQVEIAEVMGVSEQRISQILSVTLQKIRNCMKDYIND